MADPFKYFSVVDMQGLGSPIVYMITLVQVQYFAEDNFGGPLTEEEQRDLPDAIMDTDNLDLLNEAVSNLRPDFRSDD